MYPSMTRVCTLAVVSVVTCVGAPAPDFSRAVAPFLSKHCQACHNNKAKAADLSLEFSGPQAALADVSLWDEVLLKLRNGQMPPAGLPRPGDAEVRSITQWIEQELDRRAASGARSDPGRVTVRRMNRAEYNNTIRDLFGIPLRPADDFPADDSGYGFDNIGDVLSLPPVLMENYLRAAEKVAAAVIPLGSPLKPTLERRLADNLEQSRRVDYDDPAGYPYPPGAFEVKHVFPVEAEYDLVLRIKDRRKDKTALVPVRFYFDGQEIGRYQIQDGEYEQGAFAVRRFVTAGEHTLYGAFPKEYVNRELWDEAQFGKALFKEERRIFVDQFEITGPYGYDPRKSAAWRRVFICQEQTAACAERIIESIARRAFRRPVAPNETAKLMSLVTLASQQGDSFETGIQLALRAILVSPNFLFRIERDHDSDVHRISGFELASRLSYFLWSSIPDDQLLNLAGQGRLSEPEALDAQVKRMLRDGRSEALVKNFAGQWLQLRNLEKSAPDPDLFRNFNEQLRQSLIAETERYFEYVMRENRSILEFVDSNYTFLNARLAKHYGIDGIQGPELRRVNLPSKERGGLLTQGSILTVSSYPTRTSPVLRGLWVLENFLGAPPPPPPAWVPPLDEAKIGLDQPLRKQLEQHRANATCAVCHNRMDAIGFGLENYDAVGAWRSHDGKFPVDAAGALPGGKSFQGPAELKNILSDDKDAFTRNLVSKMLTFALGRGLMRSDRSEVLRISKNVARNGYRFQSMITEIVNSTPFQMRRGEVMKRAEVAQK